MLDLEIAKELFGYEIQLDPLENGGSGRIFILREDHWVELPLYSGRDILLVWDELVRQGCNMDVFYSNYRKEYNACVGGPGNSGFTAQSANAPTLGEALCKAALEYKRGIQETPEVQELRT